MRLKKYISVESCIFFYYISFDFLQTIFLLKFRIFVGDFFPWEITLPCYKIWLIFLLNIGLYLIFFKLLFLNFIKPKRIFKKHIHFDTSLLKFIDWFFLFWIILRLLYVFIGGIKAGFVKYPIWSFIILVSDTLFPFYYILNRAKAKFLYFLNISLYVISTIFQGWIGNLLLVAILELYIRKEKVHLIYLFSLPLVLLLGILFYQYVYPLKIAIRSGTNILDIKPISFEQSAYLLIGRLSMMGNLLAIIQYSQDILDILNTVLPNYFTIFKIIPFFIYKELFPSYINLKGDIGNVLWIYKVGYETSKNLILNSQICSFGLPFLGTIWILFLRNPIEALLFIFEFLFYFLILKMCLDILNCKKLYFPLFLYLMYFVREGSTLFSTSYIFSLLTFLFTIVFIKNLFKLLKLSKVKE